MDHKQIASKLAENTDMFRRALTRVEGIEHLEHDESLLEDRRYLNCGIFHRNAFYFDPERMQEDIDNEYEFEPNMAKMQGATDSFHGVIFGRLHSYTSVVDVAVKPYHTAKAGALREHIAYNFMHEKGFESIKPLGVVAVKGKAYLLTQERPSLKTFDNMRWSPEALKSGDLAVEQSELLGKAAIQLGRMHAMGITHGDAQPKNVALSERGRVSFIDLEALVYNPQQICSEQMNKRISDDVLLFYSRLRKWYGYCRSDNLENRFKNFYDNFMLPYEYTYKVSLPEHLKDKAKNNLLLLTGNLVELMMTEDK